ncbi:hypothetical protein [uncultured Clostridium sp.]|uniref:hypothetical protein n=1 Tax=uncultured Clostridium sp. TaxID=59620 RepID=UPI0025F2798A|nr:hypothetical protein [uncultured Clostridium sp.]
MIYNIKLSESQIETIMNALFGVEAEFGNAEDEMEIYKYLELVTGLNPSYV